MNDPLIESAKEIQALREKVAALTEDRKEGLAAMNSWVQRAGELEQQLAAITQERNAYRSVAELYKESTVCAAPSSEEVRIIVSRLRVIANAIADANYNELTMRIPAEPDRDADIVTMRAADLIERLAARVPTTAMGEAIAAGDGTLHGAIDYWQERALKAEAARVPDGCVVVPREPTEDVRCVLATPGNYRTYQDQWAAMIAAGEVKPTSLESQLP